MKRIRGEDDDNVKKRRKQTSAEFYVMYQSNSPVPIHTEFTQLTKREMPLKTVGHLIAAYKAAVAPRLDNVPIDGISLHLPEGLARSALSEDCFLNVDENDTTLAS